MFQLSLQNFKSDNQIRVWYSSNRDVSAQLEKLAPIYAKGASGPHFCSGLSARMTVSNGPDFSGAGLPLGVFANEHAEAKKALDAVQSVRSWWTTFLGFTPLWMRTAYNWEKPTQEQKAILKNARKTMLSYAPSLARNTNMQYHHLSGNTHLQFESSFLAKEKTYVDAPYWTAFVAGQQFVALDNVRNNAMSFTGLSRAMPGVQTYIKNTCQVVCELHGWEDMNDFQIKKTMANLEKLKKIPLNVAVDISYL